MTTAQEVEEHANRIAMLGMGQSVVLLRQYAALIKTHANVVAENAMLREAMDKYSEDEVLLIERFAKACESVYESYESKCDTWPEARPDALSGAEDCIRAIRTLKEAKK